MVTGTTTAWLSTVRAGDFLFVGTNIPVEVLSVQSNTQLTLVLNWAGSTAAGQIYAIAQGPLWGDVTRLSVQIASLIASSVQILSGTGVPSNSIGADGSAYFRQDAPELYFKAAGVWGTAIPLTGPTGSVGPGYAGTSTSTSGIGLGTNSFAIQAGLAYVVGSRVRFSVTASPTNFMEGIVTSYVGTTMIFNSDLSNGSGSFSAWTVSIAGARGATGATGASYAAASTTSLTIGTGSRSFTVAA
ncbi:MAG: hypothetical protein K2X41_13185, partial [Hyphomicrobium sp.]|nr:hypothetical protein [Hyphomicrobium sp.]